MQQVQAVVARSKGAPVTIETINVPDPGPGEALVKVQTCGVCHTDLHYREGGINDEFPFLLGHEAAGVVEAVGDDVTEVAPGDFVVLNWRAVCGDCRACNRGEPWYCFSTFNATQKMTLEDGTELSPALGIGVVRGEDPGRGRPVHQGRRGGPRGGGRPARLWRDGRHRCRDQHRQREPREVRRGDRLRRRRRGRDRGVGARRSRHDHRRRHRRPEARDRPQARRHPHGEQQGDRRGRGDPGPHRHLRRRRGHRRGRPARRPGSRRSTRATSPAPSCSSACRPRTCGSPTSR